MSNVPTNAAFKKITANNITDDYVQLIRGSDKTVLLWIDAFGNIQGQWAIGIAAAIAAATTPPGGSNPSVQYNDGGRFGGDSNLIWVKGTQIFTVVAPSTGGVSIINTAAATNSVNHNSPLLTIAGTVWSGSASEKNSWTIQNQVQAGNAGTVQTLVIAQYENYANSEVNIQASLVCGAFTPSSIVGNVPITLSKGIATGGGNLSSPLVTLEGSWWDGAAAHTSSTTIQEAVGAGTTPTDTLTIANSGAYNWGGVVIQGELKASMFVVGTAGDTGLSRIAAGVIGFGNGTQGDTSAYLEATGFYIGNGSNCEFRSGTIELPNTGTYTFSSTANASASPDLGLSRDSAGVLDVGNGVAGDKSGTVQEDTFIAGRRAQIPQIHGSDSTNGWAMNYRNPGLELGSIAPVWWDSGGPGTGADTSVSRTAAATVGIGNGAQGDTSGTLQFKTAILTASASAPTSAGTAGTVGQIIAHGGVLYFCSVTGAAGAATWNSLNMTAV